MEIKNEQIKYADLMNDPDGFKYICVEDFYWYSRIFKQFIFIPKGRKSDGATGARDLGIDIGKLRGLKRAYYRFMGWLMQDPKNVKTCCWFVHDEACINGCFLGGRLMSTIMCSIVLAEAAWRDGYKREAIAWLVPTFVHGGGETRNNGLLWVKK